jgi:hypothetical protein
MVWFLLEGPSNNYPTYLYQINPPFGLYYTRQYFGGSCGIAEPSKRSIFGHHGQPFTVSSLSFWNCLCPSSVTPYKYTLLTSFRTWSTFVPIHNTFAAGTRSTIQESEFCYITLWPHCTGLSESSKAWTQSSVRYSLLDYGWRHLSTLQGIMKMFPNIST